MKKRFLSIAAFAMACAMAVTGCSSGSTESTAEGETAEGAAEGGALDDNVLTVATVSYTHLLLEYQKQQ